MEEGVPPRGTCQGMCPEEEVCERAKWNDFHALELRIPSTSYAGWTRERLAIKKHKRNIDSCDRHPTRLRTIGALTGTVDHMLGILDVEGVDFEDAYKLLWDRMRSVRSDLMIQRLLNRREATVMYEKMVRYHIVCSYELCERKASVKNPHGFDQKLNTEQLGKTLQTLLTIYDHKLEGSRRHEEAEFWGYSILLGLDAFKLMQVRRDLLDTEEVQFALCVLRAVESGNYSKFFQLWRRATYLQACLVHLAGLHALMRRHALELMGSKVFGPKVATYPLEDARKILSIASSEAGTTAEAAGEVQDDKLCLEISSKRTETFSKIVSGGVALH
ncbi:SAC3/GANP/THP3 family protein [Chloropicon primus]|uniref:SAC3/GANP/THP3 family protein n=1 Tax=Chloropicon primus TaxID=1764295 RepID=A0A5B8ME72_9CHLO|nr:SAC3/GANP/THP3 family protein [Chloropicon primus]UPQ96810.1 SAC3/GANP/THP3 family protein [Chloropicon primus]|eukprot:QDZ17592.1 SAC3/GANP/THP3 family protein [Chloropicon primus]